ncbi:MAG: hypothetical protein KJZ93_27625 [Caldilineaceae bacterium]|nr:hypothetical protein [Caldilineaceae bacterium]
MLAARQPAIAFEVTLAAPAVRGDVLANAALDLLAEQSATPAATAQLVEQERTAMRLALGADWAALEEHLYRAILSQLKTLPEEGQEALGDLDALAKEQAAIEVRTVYQNPRFAFNLRHDPATDWAQVRVPVLALYAEFDDTVIASINQPALETALAKANNGDVTVSLVAGVNHLFLAAEEANAQAWATLPQTLAPQVVETIVDWLVARVHV